MDCVGQKIPRKDARLPVMLQRAMAAEAEAARNARAKVILIMVMMVMMSELMRAMELQQCIMQG